jgi:RNA polymerase sigma factor (sigma-70 family)
LSLEEFGQFYEANLSRLLSFLRPACGSPETAWELAQESFLRVWNKYGDHSPKEFRPLLYAVARNLLRDEGRRREERPEEERPEPDGGTAIDPVAHAEMIRVLRQAIANLPPDQRNALVLCKILGWSNRKAADALGVEESTIEQRIKHAKNKLREALGGDTEETQ